MKIDRINISNIPSIIWGEKSNRVFIAVHGNMSNKEDEVIKILAEQVESKSNNTDNIPEIGKMLINDGIKNNELEFKLHVG